MSDLLQRSVQRQILLAATLCALVIGASAPARAAGAAVCQSSVTATFNPGLTGTTTRTLEIRFSGSLTNCIGTSPSTAAVSSGNVWTDPITGFEWQEPVGTLTGTCPSNSSTATVINRWSDGSVSITSYASNGLTYASQGSGINVAAATLSAVNQKPGQGSSLVLAATRDVGAAMVGLTGNIDPDRPVDAAVDAFNACGGSGLTAATLNGIEAFAGLIF